MSTLLTTLISILGALMIPAAAALFSIRLGHAEANYHASTCTLCTDGRPHTHTKGGTPVPEIAEDEDIDETPLPEPDPRNDDIPDVHTQHDRYW